MSGLSPRAVADALTAARAGPPEDGCKVLVGLQAPRVLWANSKAEKLFGTGERLALGRKIFGTSSGGRPLSTRLSRLEPGAPPSLEGLQIVSRFARTPVIFRCLAVPGLPQMVLLEADDAFLNKDMASSNQARPPSARVPTPAADGTARTEGRPPASNVPAVTEGDDHRPARFRWRTNADGQIIQIGPEMQARLGRAALQIGDAFAARLRLFGTAAANDIAEALESRRGWSGATVAWPGAGSDHASVTLGGTPVPGGGGFLGFGLVHGRLDAAAVDSPPGDQEDLLPPPNPEDLAEAEQTGSVTDASNAIDESAALSENAPYVADLPPADDKVGAGAPPAIEALVSAEPQPGALTPAPVADVEVADRDTIPAETAASDVDQPTAPPADIESWDRPVSARTGPFPRVIAPGTGKVVHLAAFKTGLPALSGRAAVQRDPPVPSATPNETPPLAEPQWAEAPASGSVAPEADGRLSKDERFNFDEIARALAVLPLPGAGGRPTAEGAPTRVAPERPHGTAGGIAPAMPIDLLQMLDALPVSLLVTRGDELLFANRALLDLVGYRTVDDLRSVGGSASVLGTGEPASGGDPQRCVVRRQDGTTRTVEAMGRDTRWADQPATVWTVRAIEAEPARKPPETEPPGGSRTDLIEALDLAASGVGFLDDQGSILWINGGAERLFGTPAGDLVGVPCGTLFDPAEDGWPSFFAALKAASPARHSTFRKLTARKRSGETALVGVSLRRIAPDRICIVWQQSAHGHATASELDLLRRDAERASAQKSEFLARISHEIRTPLNAMLGFTEIIIDERFGPIGNDRYREYLKDIQASGTHVVSLVNDLLDLSRIEAGAQELALAAVDVNAIIGECVAAMQGQAFRDRVVIRSSLAACAPLALADDRSVRQIVLNLLSNAVKFNEPGGQVIVSTALSDSGRVLVRVRDTGLGMSDDDIDVAMKPFRQLATPRASAGSGLGLPLTKAIVEACHGGLRITSKPGDGTLVEVTFQRAPDLPISLPAE